MRTNPKFLLPVGYKGIMKYPNTHDVPEGTKFEILAHNSEIDAYHYTVKFFGKGMKHLNMDRPFIMHSEIDFGENGDLIYGT